MSTHAVLRRGSTRQHGPETNETIHGDLALLARADQEVQYGYWVVQLVWRRALVD
jgi:hypothetical protein